MSDTSLIGIAWRAPCVSWAVAVGQSLSHPATNEESETKRKTQPLRCIPALRASDSPDLTLLSARRARPDQKIDNLFLSFREKRGTFQAKRASRDFNCVIGGSSLLPEETNPESGRATVAGEAPVARDWDLPLGRISTRKARP